MRNIGLSIIIFLSMVITVFADNKGELEPFNNDFSVEISLSKIADFYDQHPNYDKYVDWRTFSYLGSEHTNPISDGYDGYYGVPHFPYDFDPEVGIAEEDEYGSKDISDRFMAAYNKLYKITFLDPDNLPARLNLAYLQFILFQYERAKENIFYVLDKDPTNLQALKMLLMTYRYLDESGWLWEVNRDDETSGDGYGYDFKCDFKVSSDPVFDVMKAPASYYNKIVGLLNRAPNEPYYYIALINYLRGHNCVYSATEVIKDFEKNTSGQESDPIRTTELYHIAARTHFLLAPMPSYFSEAGALFNEILSEIQSFGDSDEHWGNTLDIWYETQALYEKGLDILKSSPRVDTTEGKRLHKVFLTEMAIINIFRDEFYLAGPKLQQEAMIEVDFVGERIDPENARMLLGLRYFEYDYYYDEAIALLGIDEFERQIGIIPNPKAQIVLLLAKEEESDGNGHDPSLFTEIEDYPTTYWLDEAEEHIRQKNFSQALNNINMAFEYRPLYWRTWYLSAIAKEEQGKLYHAAPSYLKAVTLLEACGTDEVTPCGDFPDKDEAYGQILFEAGFAHLKIAQYEMASNLLAKAAQYAEGNLKDSAIEWHAVAQTGAEDLAASWKTYRNIFRGEPFPVFNDRTVSAKKIKRSKKTPFGFYAMVRQGFLDLRNKAYSGNSNFAEYAHAQNVSRVEALQTMATRKRQLPLFYESYQSRNYLINQYLRLLNNASAPNDPDNSKLLYTPEFRISPALSPYAQNLARLAEKAVDRKKYVEAENLYRLALATDPWWLEGNRNLAELEFINYGWCGPDQTIPFMAELLDRGVHSYFHGSTINMVYIAGYFGGDLQNQLDQIYREAEASNSFNLQNWCNIDGAIAIRPDRAVSND